MVSDADLVARLQEILRSSDLNTTTAGAVRRQLESDFFVDLSDRKKFISAQIDLFLNAGDLSCGDDVSPENDVAGDGDNDGEEELEEDEEAEEEEEDGDVEHDVKNGKKKRSEDVETNKKRGGGFTKLCSISPQLEEFLGVSEMARTQVVKKMWDYIKEHDLQDPKNRRNINCDEKLRSIFRVNTINMFQMNKALSKHIWPLEAEEESATNSRSEKKQKHENEEEPAANSLPPEKKQKHQKEEEPATNSLPPEKKQKRQKEEDAGNSKREAKQQKGGTTGFLKPLKLSDALVNFLGTGETTLSRADTVKRLWDYIKQNNLQDPSDKRRILCDEKLKELFDVESFHGFSVSKLLTAHLTKIEE